MSDDGGAPAVQGCLLDEGARDTINEGTNVSVVGAPTARGCLIEGGGRLFP